MTDPNPIADALRRTISLVYGILENGTPFWVFVAVKPTRYQAFMTAHNEGKLNLYEFDSYGEIIISGEGKSPPDEITLKVAEVYQTKPELLMEAAKDGPPDENVKPEG